jgi:mRNA interferase MazF
MNSYEPNQGDVIWLNFSPSIGNEMKGNHPVLIVSSNAYNRKTNYVIVSPITSHGNNFAGYVKLEGYKIHGRVNAVQIHSFSLRRMTSANYIERIRGEDMLAVKQIQEYALQLDFK